MRIAQLVSNLHRTSAHANNAIYSHVGSLSDGLVQRGHDVTLFGAGDSATQARLQSVYPEHLSTAPISHRAKQHYARMLIARCYEQASSFDLIHSHFSLLSSFHARPSTTPTIISIHSPIDDELRPFIAEFKQLPYISFSLAQRKAMPELNWIANIYHGVDTEYFSFSAESQPYVLYLGRVTNDKGVHLAIQAAKQAGTQLLIAGRSYPEEGYWHSEIEQHIDGVTVRYVGQQGLAEKTKLLQGARALLFPTQTNEVFGYVMIEAMSCGTPVIGWNNGSVPEIVQHGQTGFVVESVDDMTAAIAKIGDIDRAACRKRAELYFSIEKMVTGYEKVYKRVLSDEAFKAAKRPSGEISA